MARSECWKDLLVYRRLSASFSESVSGYSKPGLSFALGAALVFCIILTVTIIFYACFLRRRSLTGLRVIAAANWPVNEAATTTHAGDSFQFTTTHAHQFSTSSQVGDSAKPNSKVGGLVPVIMPGDNLPKFMAWPCPADQYDDHSYSTNSSS